ncbi:MAG: transporter substrate-binding domain-containing protein [Campylobacterales bacterium]|nr:transporter substrate-binding domain-containing protein [Campylobacterales bacterium]
MQKLIALFLIALSCLKAQQQELIVNSGFPIPETYLVESIVTEAFKRAGIAMRYQTLPPERSLINVNMGLDDVEAARIEGIDKNYPNLVRVPVAIHSIDIVLLSRNNSHLKGEHIKTLADLKSYNVGLIKGVKIAETIAQKAAPKSITKATSYRMLIKMLVNGRIDTIITSKIALLTMLSETKAKGLHMTSKPLVSLPLYTHINKKYKYLVPKLEKAYQSMQEDGTIKKLHNNFLHDLEHRISVTVDIVDD